MKVTVVVLVAAAAAAAAAMNAELGIRKCYCYKHLKRHKSFFFMPGNCYVCVCNPFYITN